MYRRTRARARTHTHTHTAMGMYGVDMQVDMDLSMGERTPRGSETTHGHGRAVAEDGERRG
jgi:hypothetical protein